MGWREDQKYRLAVERVLVNEHMPGFVFRDPVGDTLVEGSFVTSANKAYGVRIEIPSGFPDQCPRAYITSPSPLWSYGQSNSLWRKLMEKNINEKGISHEMHTLSPHSNGWVQVCHFRPERWSADLTLIQVLLKVRLWLEAYELHSLTGRPIDDFLLTQN